MASVSETIEVRCPVALAYDRWTRFEGFPQFMEHVDEVSRSGPDRLHWRATIAGDTQEWDAEVTEQVPGRVVAWRSVGGIQNHGRVSFEQVDADVTRLHVQMEFEPSGIGEKVASAAGVAGSSVRADLERFRALVEDDGAGVPAGTTERMSAQGATGEVGGTKMGAQGAPPPEQPSAGDDL